MPICALLPPRSAPRDEEAAPDCGRLRQAARRSLCCSLRRSPRARSPHRPLVAPPARRGREALRRAHTIAALASRSSRCAPHPPPSCRVRRAARWLLMASDGFGWLWLLPVASDCCRLLLIARRSTARTAGASRSTPRGTTTSLTSACRWPAPKREPPLSSSLMMTSLIGACRWPARRRDPPLFILPWPSPPHRPSTSPPPPPLHRPLVPPLAPPLHRPLVPPHRAVPRAAPSHR